MANEQKDITQKPRRDIRAIMYYLKKDREHIDTSKIYRLKKGSHTHMDGEKGHAKGAPEIGQILKVTLKDGTRCKMVVVQTKVARAESTIKRVLNGDGEIFAYTKDYLFEPDVVEEFNSFMKKKNWNEMTPAPIIVVKGYHFGKRAINTMKPYNFRVNRQTKNVRWMKEGNTARVKTAQGDQSLVINQISYMKGSMARKMAFQLEPVVTFRTYKLHGLYAYFYKKNVLDKQK